MTYAEEFQRRSATADISENPNMACGSFLRGLPPRFPSGWKTSKAFVIISMNMQMGGTISVPSIFVRTLGDLKSQSASDVRCAA